MSISFVPGSFATNIGGEQDNPSTTYTVNCQPGSGSGSDTTAGNLVIVYAVGYVQHGDLVSTASISMHSAVAGLTWNGPIISNSGYSESANVHTVMFYALDAPSISKTNLVIITVTCATTSGYTNLIGSVLMEFTGFTVATYDTQGVNVYNVSPPHGSITPANSGELIIAGVVGGNNTSTEPTNQTAGTGYTLGGGGRGVFAGANPCSMMAAFEYNTSGGSGTLTPGWGVPYDGSIYEGTTCWAFASSSGFFTGRWVSV